MNQLPGNSQVQANELPAILARSEHLISRSRIDEPTLKVLYRLKHAGYKAYLVGGSVRDLLLERPPKDFDVGTDATPQQMRKLFRNCFLVGRRFRLAHVRFADDQVVEVATFRRHPAPEEYPEDLAEHAFFVQNQFGTPREDAFRRDFTINALFYDISTFSVIDYVGGLADLAARRLRVIGNPLTRFTEDPVRMLRALEFAARLGFSIEESAREAIYTRASLIAEAAPARVREEILSLFRYGVGGQVLRTAQAMGLLAPMMADYEGDELTFSLLEQLDQMAVNQGQADEALMIAALFLSRFWRNSETREHPPAGEILELAGLLISPYCNYFRISHGLRHQARELLLACHRLRRGMGRRGERRFLRHPATPLALELYQIWLQVSGGDLQPVEQWRTALLEQQSTAPANPQNAGASLDPAATSSRRRRPRRRRARPRSG